MERIRARDFANTSWMRSDKFFFMSLFCFIFDKRNIYQNIVFTFNM